jgi:hypothetical protein
MTYMPARSLVRHSQAALGNSCSVAKGCVIRGKTTPAGYRTKSWAIGASRAYASPGAAADQPGVQDGTSFYNKLVCSNVFSQQENKLFSFGFGAALLLAFRPVSPAGFRG